MSEVKLLIEKNRRRESSRVELNVVNCVTHILTKPDKLRQTRITRVMLGVFPFTPSPFKLAFKIHIPGHDNCPLITPAPSGKEFFFSGKNKERRRGGEDSKEPLEPGTTRYSYTCRRVRTRVIGYHIG